MYHLSSSSTPSIRPWDQLHGETFAGKSAHCKDRWSHRVARFWIDKYIRRWNCMSYMEDARQSLNYYSKVTKKTYIRQLDVTSISPIHIYTTLNWPQRTILTAEFHQDTWNHYLMLGFVSAHSPCHTISNLELHWWFNALQRELLLPSASSLSNLCQREYSLTVDAIKKQLLSTNRVSSAWDGRTSMNQLAITSVIAYNMHQNWKLLKVQLVFDEVESLSISYLECKLRIIGQESTCWSKPSHVCKAGCVSFRAYRRLFIRNYDW